MNGTRRRRGAALKSTLAAAAAGLLVLGTGQVALALESDTAEAEGRVLSGGGAINLNDIASLAPAYQASPSAPGAGTAPLSLEILNALGLNVGGVTLFGENGVIGVGALQQYASATPTTATAASGAVLENGAIDLGGSGVQDNAFVDVGALLAGVPATDGLIDGLRVELGALSATATNDAGVLTSDYQIAGGDLIIQSPLVSELNGALVTTLDDLSGTVNAAAGAGGTLDTALDGITGGLVGPLADLISDLTLGAVNVDTPELQATLTADLSTAITSLSPLVSADGSVTINLAEGTIALDIATLLGAPGGTLNDLPPGTELISASALSGLLAPGGALTEVLNQVPATLVGAIEDTLESTTVSIQLATAATLGVLPLVDIDITVAGTLGALVANDAAGLTTDISAEVLGGLLDLGPLTASLFGFVADDLVPALATPLTGLLTDAGGIATSTVTPLVTDLLADLAPALDLVSGLVSITANVQETPGEFTHANGFVTPDTFTQRAVTVSVLPAFGALAEVNLASATVRAPVPPAITAITPTEGPETGGTEVTITGTEFTDATGVTFDGVPGTEFTVVSDTEITVVTPAGTPGDADVVVTGLVPSAPGVFTYLAVPSILGLDPDFGPEDGGTVVTITGDDFTGATGVTFGGVAGTDFAVVSDEEITVTTPAGIGIVDVIVEHPVENSAPGEFTYVAPGAPLVSDIDPDRGPETGGTIVTITGDGFEDDPVTAVTFGGVAALEFEVVSDTEITATSPAGTPGTVDVNVWNAAGASGPLDFTYFAVTSIDDVDPGSGPEDGGNTVTLTGACFTGATGVTFDGVPGTDFQVIDDNTITVTVPAGTPGTVDVVVINPTECGDGEIEDGYEYIAEPTIIAVDPAEGPQTGGTVVTITGEDFTDASGATFDGTAGTDFQVVSDTEIIVTTPAGIPGVAEVVVTSPGGASDPADFTYLAVPTIDTITPDSGPVDGGTTVTIIGDGFTDATDVTFGGEPGTDFEVVSDTEITVVTPPGVGVVDVIVEHPVADSNAVQFTYVAPVPLPATITPDEGPETGGTQVTITGTDLGGVESVTFDGVEATDVTVVSDTVVTAVTPAGTPGVAAVVLSSTGGDSAPLEFTYYAVTQIDDVDPDTGPGTGGTEVTITGSCFTGATGVLFGDTPAQSFTVVNDTTIVAVSPAGVGTVDITVIATDCGDGTLPGGFTYTEAGGPAGLPVTGADAAPAALAGLLLLLGGLAMMAGAIRRRMA